MSLRGWIALILGIMLLATGSAAGENKLPPKAPKINGLGPLPNNQNKAKPPANIVPNNQPNPNQPGFNLNPNNNGLNGFNQVNGGGAGPAFANSQLNQLYQAASPFNNPFSNPFLTPFNNPNPIVNNPFTNGYVARNMLGYGSNPFYSPMNNVYQANPFAYPGYNNMGMNPYANPAMMNPYANPYMNPYMNPYGMPPGDPLANPFLPSMFYSNLLQNPTPFNQFNK